MMTILALALAAAPLPQSTPPSEEAAALGVRLARAGTLATLLPMMVKKETEELLAAHPALSAADRALLRQSAEEVGRDYYARVLQVEGHADATLLSVEDLRALVAFEEGPVGKRYRAVRPRQIMATMEGLGGLDFKKDAVRAFCTRTGKLCEPAEKR